MASPRQAGTAYPVRRALMVLVSAFGHDANTVIVYCCVVKSGERGQWPVVGGQGVVVFSSQFLVFGERRWRAVVCREERRLQHLLATEGHGGARRTATATDTPFVHEGPLRDTKNGNGKTFFVHGGPRRATENCNCNTFCRRRTAGSKWLRQDVGWKTLLARHDAGEESARWSSMGGALRGRGTAGGLRGYCWGTAGNCWGKGLR